MKHIPGSIPTACLRDWSTNLTEESFELLWTGLVAGVIDLDWLDE
jgi:hypothetical protein